MRTQLTQAVVLVALLAGSMPGTTRAACITDGNPIPADAHCSLDDMKRNGGIVNWAMTCNSPQGPIKSAGTARFTGDAMEATLTARVPGPNGQPVDTPGRITGL